MTRADTSASIMASTMRLLLATVSFLALGPPRAGTVVGFPFEMDWSVVRYDQSPRVLQTSGGVRHASSACSTISVKIVGASVGV
jgi:hypothetical protein